MPEAGGIVPHEWSVHAANDVCMTELASSAQLFGAATCIQSLTCQEHISACGLRTTRIPLWVKP